MTDEPDRTAPVVAWVQQLPAEPLRVGDAPRETRFVRGELVSKRYARSGRPGVHCLIWKCPLCGDRHVCPWRMDWADDLATVASHQLLPCGNPAWLVVSPHRLAESRALLDLTRAAFVEWRDGRAGKAKGE
jgi:hypothetical protein